MITRLINAVLAWKPADKMCGWCGQANDYRNTHCVKCGAEL